MEEGIRLSPPPTSPSRASGSVTALDELQDISCPKNTWIQHTEPRSLLLPWRGAWPHCSLQSPAAWLLDTLVQQFSNGLLLPQGQLAVSGDIFGCCSWVGALLAPSRLRPGKLLKVVQCTEQSPHQDLFGPKCQQSQGSRNPSLPLHQR